MADAETDKLTETDKALLEWVRRNAPVVGPEQARLLVNLMDRHDAESCQKWRDNFIHLLELVAEQNVRAAAATQDEALKKLLLAPVVTLHALVEKLRTINLAEPAPFEVH